MEAGLKAKILEILNEDEPERKNLEEIYEEGEYSFSDLVTPLEWAVEEAHLKLSRIRKLVDTIDD